MMAERRTWSIALALIIALQPGCSGGDGDESGEEQSADQAAQEPAPTPVADPSAPGPITAADLDAYERGMLKEKEILVELNKKAETAKSDEDQLAIMLAATEDQTMDDGAQAAGMPLDRYRQLVNSIGEALGASAGSTMVVALRKQMNDIEAQLAKGDSSGMTPAQIEDGKKNLESMRQQLDAQEKGALEKLAPDARDAFNQRAPRLDSLRMELVGLRIKVAS